MLSNADKNLAAEMILLGAMDSVEFLTVSEHVGERYGDVPDSDLADIHDLVVNAEVEITFRTDD